MADPSTLWRAAVREALQPGGTAALRIVLQRADMMAQILYLVLNAALNLNIVSSDRLVRRRDPLSARPGHSQSAIRWPLSRFPDRSFVIPAHRADGVEKTLTTAGRTRFAGRTDWAKALSFVRLLGYDGEAAA